MILLKQLKTLSKLTAPNFVHQHAETSSTSAKESFLSGSSSTYIEDMYNAWIADPSSVHASWDSYFRNVSSGRRGYESPPTGQTGRVASTSAPAGNYAASSSSDVADIRAVEGIIRSYQIRGHMVAQLDPLGILYSDQTTVSDRQGGIPKIIKRQHKLGNIDPDKVFKLPQTTFIGGSDTHLPLREIIHRIEMSYCRHIGAQYMHITNFELVTWIRKKMESENTMKLSNDEKMHLLHRLTHAATFEAFLAKKFPSEKRFGLEGCDIAIPGLKQIIDKSSEYGCEHFIIGMPHRGRLNVLANVCRKPLSQIFTQFAALESEDEGSGDVKYHLGTTNERLTNKTKKTVIVSVIANPSHLEAVNPVVQGKVKAHQFYAHDHEGQKTMAILLHGDAAFAGQGVVFESMHLANLPKYTTHGTIHMVVNNQIGFTTDPRHSRSSRYCTDVGKVLEAPILHVNSDDPESVIHVCNMAAEWRATTHRDIVIDIVGYRRNGHNEIDEPMFTQPLMYKQISKLKPVHVLYANKLMKEKVCDKEDVERAVEEYNKKCEEALVESRKQTVMRYKDWLDSPWKGFFTGKKVTHTPKTGIAREVLVKIATKFASPPSPSKNFEMHKGVERILKARMDMVKQNTADWAIGEALAFGSLLISGHHVRLSGQDVERGTFSHRHHILHDQSKDKEVYNMLANLSPHQATYTVCNSSLSEYGVLGFELGYSMTSPHSLIIWEAQFGDFCNTAQCIIDQFVATGQSKWVRQSGLVMLLPHGMEGMGPEHSSGRLERFLQMCDDDEDNTPKIDDQFAITQLYKANWIVANCSTPANFFHIMRRQLKLPFRKPLVLLTPKSLLRNPVARSDFSEMETGTEFRRLIPENGPAFANKDKVRKLIFCSGKVYYDFIHAREQKGLEKEIAIARIEQISPFPYDLLIQECAKYPKAKICWGQEEHKNHGAWYYVKPRARTALERKRRIFYLGRASAASPATGSKVQHMQEVKKLLKDAMKV